MPTFVVAIDISSVRIVALGSLGFQSTGFVNRAVRSRMVFSESGLNWVKVHLCIGHAYIKSYCCMLPDSIKHVLNNGLITKGDA